MSKLVINSTVSDLFFTKSNYERNISDIKNIYTNQLVSILTPCMFDSIKNIYNRACDIVKDNNKMTIEYAFKVCLKDLFKLSSTSIINEVNKIKQISNSASYFDNLIRSVIKSHIVLMSYNVSKEDCPLCDMRKYNIDINRFIHECYIELGNQIFNDPKIFILTLKDGELLNDVSGTIRCGNKFDKLVKKCISKVIFDFVPVNEILTEYLNKDKITDRYGDAKREMEKDDIINKIITGINENNIIKTDEIIVQLKNEFSNQFNTLIKLLNEIKNTKPSDQTSFKPEEPVILNHETTKEQSTVDQNKQTTEYINDVISKHDIQIEDKLLHNQNDIDKQNNINEYQEKDKININVNENNEIVLSDNKLNDNKQDDNKQDDMTAEKTVNSSNDKEITVDQNIIEEQKELEKEIQLIESSQDNKQQGGDNTISLFSDNSKPNVVNSIEEINNDNVEEIKPKRRGRPGRPKKFTTDILSSTINSIDKFK